MKALTDPRDEDHSGKIGRSATIYEVARSAGVSIATVSRVLRGTVPVAPETRTRVLAAVSRLRYVPSRLARGLAEQQHAANGVVFPDLSGPYYTEVVLGYESETAELGRSVLILSTHGRTSAPELVLDLASRVDGLVIFGRTVDDDVVHWVVETGLPVLLLARPAVAEADTLKTENTRSARRLTGHLLDHGYRRLLFLGNPAVSADVAERWEGVSAVLDERGVAVPDPVPCGFSEDDGYAVGRAVLSSPDRPEALICANDEIALGALLAGEDLGVRVPDDIALTGWDDVMAARYARPALTTVRQPMRELGERAARALHQRITGTRSTPLHEVLPTQLVIRASCGPHREEETR
ncbi:MAG TPA: LacI family DNA-binding transcriptional regulator [Actinomycetes bacterium]|jgi:LacI family transcriptional regulator|nr:LacI family DNA-binding transcriptional regulator [Actinomycetes bacterium]